MRDRILIFLALLNISSFSCFENCIFQMICLLTPAFCQRQDLTRCFFVCFMLTPTGSPSLYYRLYMYACVCWYGRHGWYVSFSMYPYCCHLKFIIFFIHLFNIFLVLL